MPTPWSQYFSEEALELTRRSIRLALDEDGRDLTSIGVFTPDVSMRARIVAKEATWVVGLPLIAMVFSEIGCEPVLAFQAEEASQVPAMTEIVRIQAPATALLRAERVILNYVAHLSGIANLTARYVQELEGTGVTLLDTRKTTPGMRWLEKYAVQAAGAGNHRRNLEELLMLKDNHIDQAGSITKAVERLRASWKPCPPIEVECRTLDHVQEAVACQVERIMMDNMRGSLLAEALDLVPAGIETEVSGGVSLENLRSLALSGRRRPDFISVGRLTHSAVSADFSMTLQPDC